MSLPYFPLYATDFDGKTAHLTLVEDGAYNRLLRLCWKTPGCRIPADETWIMRHMRARSQEEQEAVRTILAEFFAVKGGFYSNKKLTEIWLASSEAHERRKNAGSQGGKAKALRTRKLTSSNAVAKPKQPEPEPEPDKKERDTDVSLVLSAPEPASPLAEAVTLFNEAAVGAGWSKVQKMTPARSQALRARLRECDGIEGWRIAMDKAKASDFLCGRTAKPWTGCGFDWLTKQANFTKLMEGNYDDREGTGNGKPTGADIARQVAEQYTRGMDSREGSDASQPLLPARQPAGRDRGGSW